MLFLHDESTLLHETVELLGSRLIPALESPDRIRAVLRSVTSHEEHAVQRLDDLEASSDEVYAILEKTHDGAYLNHLRHAHDTWVSAGHIGQVESILPECFPTFAQDGETHSRRFGKPPKDIFAQTGYFAFDMSSGIAQGTFKSALASANLALQACRYLSGQSQIAATNQPDDVVFALCRPPGHHCDATRAGGYCYMNNAVIAVESLLNFADPCKEDEVAILDLDFHHGNGTQAYFYNRQVTYVSIHGEDEYPYYTGFGDELGQGVGLGHNFNLPLKRGTSSEEYLQTLEHALTLLTRSESLQYLVISLGFDTFHLDPLGSFDLQTEHYAQIGKVVEAYARRRGLKCAILLEGGYVIESLGDNLLSFCNPWT